MDKTKTTNALLTIIAIPVIFLILNTLGFILIPLVASMFIALLFLPIMRWMSKRNVPKTVGVALVMVIIIGFVKIGSEVIQLSAREILNADEAFLQNAEFKLVNLVESIERFLGMKRMEGENVVQHYTQKLNLFDNLSGTIDMVTGTLSMVLLIVFFVVLLLYGSIDFEHLLSKGIFKNKISSTKLIIKIERDMIRFVGVKFLISLFTGIGFSIACLVFDVSFPIFWGLFAFAINFVQMIGSVISVVVLTVFALIEIDPSLNLLLFISAITAVQVLFGAILEPIFMGKTFSINVITVVVMLSIWGFIWGVPGLIMSIPITVLIKVIIDKLPNTQLLSKLLS
ncbi:MAG: AI-2E family transporter [Bacteroidia bacterium]